MRALRKCVREVVGGDGGSVAAIGLSSQGGTVVPLDRDGKPLCRALTWLDTRPNRLAEELIPGLKRHEVYLTTGWSSMGALPLAKLFWLREHCRGLMARARRIAFTGDYVLQRMTGRAAIDPSSCAITQFYDLKRGDWCKRFLEPCGLAREMMPEILPSDAVVGGVCAPVARSLGLSSGTPVVTGAHDQYASAFGIDVRRPGDIMLATGTAWVQLAVSAQPALVDDERIGVSPCATGGRFGALMAVSYAGASFNWLRDLCGLTGFTELDAAASKCPLGAEGLRFIAARTFAGDKGAFLGLDLSHSRGHMARAIMEGVAACSASNIATIAFKTDKARHIVMTGGATESRIWPQIVADSVGLPIGLLGQFESACAGAARLAATGTGEGQDFGPPPVKRQIRPNRRNARRYAEIRDEMTRLGKALKA
jgi:sugar (pentulose or hexulose) kinase